MRTEGYRRLPHWWAAFQRHIAALHEIVAHAGTSILPTDRASMHANAAAGSAAASRGQCVRSGSFAAAPALSATHTAEVEAKFRQPRVVIFEEEHPAWAVARVPAELTDLAGAWGGVTLGDGFYRFHTPMSGARATALCVHLVPEDARHWAFAFDWNGNEICLDRDSGEIIVVDPGQGTWFNGEAELNDWHDILAAEPELLRLGRFQRWRAGHPEVDALRFDQTIGLERPLFLGGADDLNHLEIWYHDVYLALFAQLFAKTEGLPPGTVVDASILEQVRHDMGL